MAGVEGRVALVTGAGSAEGIGFATARLLRAKGAKVAITSTTDRIFERLKELGGAAYGAAKAGLLGMARSLAIEAGPHNVTVNCVGPGWIETASSDRAEILAGRYTPAGRAGTPEEVGHVALFLASEEASYITGQLIVVDGGNTIQEYKVAL